MNFHRLKNREKINYSIFYAILDTGWTNDYTNKCKQLIKSGTGIIQLRAKKESSSERRKIADEIYPLFDNQDSPILIINDDFDLAKNLPKAGLHIGQEDGNPIKMREFLGDEKILGLSTHSFNEAKNANDIPHVIDYFAVGPIYSTPTKPGRKSVGLELIQQVSLMKLNLPFFAIGGINISTVKDVANAGARKIVAVSDILKSNDSTQAITNLIKEFTS